MMYLYGVCGAHVFMVRMFVWCLCLYSTCLYGAHVCMMHEYMVRLYGARVYMMHVCMVWCSCVYGMVHSCI